MATKRKASPIAKTGARLTKEQKRLSEPTTPPVPHWAKWGPYVAERAWGTVREDYSPDGSAWGVQWRRAVVARCRRRR